MRARALPAPRNANARLGQHSDGESRIIVTIGRALLSAISLIPPNLTFCAWLLVINGLFCILELSLMWHIETKAEGGCMVRSCFYFLCFFGTVDWRSDNCFSVFSSQGLRSKQLSLAVKSGFVRTTSGFCPYMVFGTISLDWDEVGVTLYLLPGLLFA